jgi:Capsule biosynthesis GfcC
MTKRSKTIENSSRNANATLQAGQTGADQQAQLAMQQASLARLSAVRPTGRVVLEMNQDATTVADIPNLPLEDGDTFYIPPRLGTMQISGAVYNANAFRHEADKTLGAYLKDAGGATREADQKRIFAIRADGTVIIRPSRDKRFHGDFEKLRLLPADAIIVPEKLRMPSKMNDFLQITQLASQTALTAAVLSVIQ